MDYLSSVSICKNESPYIYDFYKIHKALGVEKFVFFDRTTEGKSTEEIFKNHKDVKVIHFPENGINNHRSAWAEGVKLLKGKSKWVQFIDIDQVNFCTTTNDLKVFLGGYEDCVSLSPNWHSFGSSNLEMEPEISTYEAYTLRADGKAPINNHVQSIVQIEKCTTNVWSDPHHPPLMPGFQQSNEHKQSFTGPWKSPPTQSMIFIAHYYTRSREYWAKKCAKMRADIAQPTPGGKLEEFDHHQAYMNKIHDNRIKDFWINYCKE